MLALPKASQVPYYCAHTHTLSHINHHQWECIYYVSDVVIISVLS